MSLPLAAALVEEKDVTFLGCPYRRSWKYFQHLLRSSQREGVFHLLYWLGDGRSECPCIISQISKTCCCCRSLIVAPLPLPPLPTRPEGQEKLSGKHSVVAEEFMVFSNLYGLPHVAPLTATDFTSVVGAADIALKLLRPPVDGASKFFAPSHSHSSRIQSQRLSDVQKGAVAAFHILEHNRPFFKYKAACLPLTV